MSAHRFSIAPMMEWTDRHCRSFHRLITRRARLYTEMVTTGALIHGPRARLLAFDTAEHPVALQLGGSEPDDLATCARMGEDVGFSEINLNIGCPSTRVQKGAFGACLMREPELVGDCVAAMKAAVQLPVTVKCRIGVDDQDPEQSLFSFVDTVTRAGCDIFVVHARKAWLKGLSPKDNREVPPLNYELVYRLKHERPHLTVVINGGIGDLAEARAHLGHVDGVMMGRAAYQSPWLLAAADAELFGDNTRAWSRYDVVRAHMPYIERELAKGAPLNTMTKHLLGLFNGLPGARAFRRHLSENATKPGARLEVLRAALALIPENIAESAAA